MFTAGPIRTAPLSVAETRPGKLRVIVNHSFPRNTQNSLDLSTFTPNASSYSVENYDPNPEDLIPIDPEKTSINEVIDSKKFQCQWGTFSECYLLVAQAPPGTEAAVFDVEGAFRNVPTHPSVRAFTAILLGILIHLDGCLNFGAGPAPGIWGRIADAMVAILLAHGVEALIKWVDDFIFFRYPKGKAEDGSTIFSYDESLIWNVAKELGWPWSPSKFVPFATSFTYIGFLWSLANKTVELPEEKKMKYGKKLVPWAESPKMSLEAAESIIGTLNHVCMVVPQGRSRMTQFYRFRATFKETTSRFIQHKVTAELRLDVEWWRTELRKEFVGIECVQPKEPLSLSLMVDASTGWGMGFVLDGKWLAWEFKENWKTDGREIGWGEMVVIELALRTLMAAGYRDCHIRLRSDNQGVVGALKAGYSKGSKQNAILRHIVSLMQSSKIWLSVDWVSTKDNVADAPSRGEFGPKKDIYGHPPSIPSHLKAYVHEHVSHSDPRLTK